MEDDGSCRMLNIRQIKMYLYIKSFCPDLVTQDMVVDSLTNSLADSPFLMQNAMHHYSEQIYNIV